jgi:PIN domain nuclease of toxin-antitoxin system
MIVLDTHVWIWWVNESDKLAQRSVEIIEQNVEGGLGVSIISCWEVAKLVELGRLELTLPVREWLMAAVKLNLPGRIRPFSRILNRQ